LTAKASTFIARANESFFFRFFWLFASYFLIVAAVKEKKKKMGEGQTESNVLKEEEFSRARVPLLLEGMCAQLNCHI